LKLPSKVRYSLRTISTFSVDTFSDIRVQYLCNALVREADPRLG
jgi:hypothetical protein